MGVVIRKAGYWLHKDWWGYPQAFQDTEHRQMEHGVNGPYIRLPVSPRLATFSCVRVLCFWLLVTSATKYYDEKTSYLGAKWLLHFSGICTSFTPKLIHTTKTECSTTDCHCPFHGISSLLQCAFFPVCGTTEQAGSQGANISRFWPLFLILLPSKIASLVISGGWEVTIS